MISNNRTDYSSADEWLKALKQDEAWLGKLQKLQESTPAELKEQRKIAHIKMGEQLLYGHWDTYNNNVEKVVQELWDAGLSLSNLKNMTIGMLILEYLEQNTDISIQVSIKQKRSSSKSKAKPKAKSSGKPMTLKYYTHSNNGMLTEQRRRVLILFRKYTEWGWIDPQTSPDDFDAFFEGEPRHCNIKWKASGTILTILLQELLKRPYIEKQKGCAAKSLVMNQFGKTPNSDISRLDKDSEDRINITLLILDINNPLPEPRRRNAAEEYDIRDSALQEIFAGILRSTKGI